jgi:phosphate transport system protein
MRTAFHPRLVAIDDQVRDMCGVVRGAMHAATAALSETDLGLAESVIENDAQLDTSAHEVEDRIFHLLAQHQPVAQNLRFLLAALHTAAALERMGDLAVHVAKTTRMRYPMPVIPTDLRGLVADMGAIASQMITTADVALERGDPSTARVLRDLDREMHRLHRELFIITCSPAWEHGVPAAVDISLLSRSYELFADHAVTIGERSVHVIPQQVNGSVNLR